MSTTSVRGPGSTSFSDQRAPLSKKEFEKLIKKGSVRKIEQEIPRLGPKELAGALVLSLKSGREDVAVLLIEAGADFRTTLVSDAPAFFYAIKESFVSVARAMLDRDPTLLSKRWEGRSPLLQRGLRIFSQGGAAQGISEKMALLLIEKGADFREEGFLEGACGRGRTKVISACVERDPSLITRIKISNLLSLCVASGRTDFCGTDEEQLIIRFIQQGADLSDSEMRIPEIRDTLKFSPLYLVATLGSISIAEALLEREPAMLNRLSNGEHSLTSALGAGNDLFATFLIERGADLEIVRRDVISLEIGYDRDILPFSCMAVQARCLKALEKIIEKCPSQLHIEDLRGSTLFDYACFGEGNGVGDLSRKNSEGLLQPVLSFLFEKGLSVSGKDKRGMTSLHMAVCQGCDLDVIKWFLRQDSSLLNQEDAFGNTPLHYAQTKEVVSYLVKKGARIDKNKKGMIPLQQICSLKRHFCSEQAGLNRDVLFLPFHDVLKGNSDILPAVKELVKRDPKSIHHVDKRGNTALHLACRTESEALCKFLIENGAKIHAKNKRESGRSTLLFNSEPLF